MAKQNKGAGADQHGGADVIMHLKIVRIWADFARERDLMFFTEKHLENMVQWMDEAIEKLEEQEAEIRQLRLALDIAKGTCKGIKSGGGQFADMPTMQSAT